MINIFLSRSIKQNTRKKCFLLFTFLFWGGFFIFLFRHVVGRTMALGGTDGVQQHYPAMVFIGRYIRQVFDNLMHGTLVFPLVNYEIGMGDDVINALNYYGFGDPFYLLAAFFTERTMPWFYTGLFYFRIYLGGVAFILLAYELMPKKSTLSYVAGAFLYCFSGFAFEANIHIIFVQAMMYFPLALYATEGILKGKKWSRGTLVSTMCGLGLSGFFFTYIGLGSIIIYGLLRVKMVNIKDKAVVVKFFVRTGCSVALGLGIAAVIFVPAVFGYLNSTRVEESLNVPVLYDIGAYKDMFYTFFMGKELHRSVFSFPIVGAISLIIAIIMKGHKKEKLIVAGCFAGYLLPFFSWVGTGFGSAIYDRWEIVLVIGGSLVFVSIWNGILLLTKRELLFLSLFYGIIILLGIVDRMFFDRCYRNMFLAFSGCIIFFWCGVLFPNLLNIAKKEWVWFILVMGCIVLSWWTLKVDYPVESVQKDNAVGELVKDDSFYRVENEETFMDVVQINLALTQNYCSTAEYVSIENPIYVETMNDDWRLAMSGSFAISGLDRRTMLESMCGVKYMLVKNGHDYLVPYGFVYESETRDKKWTLYRNQYVMPIAYTYDQVLDYDAYKEMDALEKQMGMCQAAAVKNYLGNINTLQHPKTVYSVEKCYINGISKTSYASDIYSTRLGQIVEMSVPISANCENYLLIIDKEADGIKEIRWNDSSLSPYMSNDLPNYINLGYYENDGELAIKLVIDEESSIELERIVSAHVNMSNYAKWMEERINGIMQEVKLSANKIEGSIKVSEDKILCTIIPYLKGWRAFVDGIEVPIYQINSLFLGIELPAGEHTICFSYCTPGLMLGLGITVISIVLYFVWYCVENRWNSVQKIGREKCC